MLGADDDAENPHLLRVHVHEVVPRDGVALAHAVVHEHEGRGVAAGRGSGELRAGRPLLSGRLM